MSKQRTDPHALARELDDLGRSLSGSKTQAKAEPQALPEGSSEVRSPHESLLLARVVRGFSREGWQEFCRAYPLSQWYALPVPDEVATGVRVADLRADPGFSGPAGAGDALLGALGSSMFTAQLERELLRLGRHGGALSLVAAGLAQRHRLATALGEGTVLRLERLLGETIHSRLEGCDSMGSQAPGRYLALLPGMGQLATRRFAENIQNGFAEQARPFFPTGGISAGSGAVCALGVIHVGQERTAKAQELLERAGAALDAALDQDEGHIHQEVSGRKASTLVHSGEKRFLFFGGEQKYSN